MPLAGQRQRDELRNMSIFDERKKGRDAQYAHDQEMEFKAQARRNKLLGLWAAKLMGKSEAEAEAYAKEVIVSDFEEAGDHDVFRKIRRDFDAAKVEQSDHQIERKMEELLAEARAQVSSS